MSRDIKSAYKAALIEEYESYLRAGRKAAADHVAGVLLAEHDYRVRDDGQEENEKAVEPSAPENTAQSAPKESAVEQKPDTARQAPAAAKKTTPAKKTTAPPAKG